MKHFVNIICINKIITKRITHICLMFQSGMCYQTKVKSVKETLQLRPAMIVSTLLPIYERHTIPIMPRWRIHGLATQKGALSCLHPQTNFTFTGTNIRLEVQVWMLGKSVNGTVYNVDTFLP